MSRFCCKYIFLLPALAFALALTLAFPAPTHAGDPEDIIGPVNLDLWECIDRDRSDDVEGDEVPDDFEIINIDEWRDKVERESVGNYADDAKKLDEYCDWEEDGARLEHFPKTKIEGYVYEFHPSDPENPAESEWFAVPSRDVPVIAEGVTFEIFWGSEPDGYFYFYKTRFGEGPIMLNLRLPEDAHPVNPDVLIESTGLDETWTVFLGFYRGDVPPPNIDQLKTPDGNLLPFGNTTFESIVGLDGKSALPGVGGVLPQNNSTILLVLAGLVAVVLPAAGLFRLRQKRSSQIDL